MKRCLFLRSAKRAGCFSLCRQDERKGCVTLTCEIPGRTPVTFPDLKKDMSEVTGTSVAPLESVLSCEKPETVEEVTDSAVKQDKRIKVTLGKLQQIQELDADG